MDGLALFADAEGYAGATQNVTCISKQYFYIVVDAKPAFVPHSGKLLHGGGGIFGGVERRSGFFMFLSA